MMGKALRRFAPFSVADGAPAAVHWLAPMLLPNIKLLPGRLLLLVLPIVLRHCDNRKNAVSGTIEVDEAHVGPRSGGRVEKIFAQEGDHLHEGQLIAQLAAPELRARRDVAAAQIDTAIHNADAQ